MSQTQCQRCQRPLRHGTAGNPLALPVRRKSSGIGVCADCAVTAFLKTTEPIASLLKRPDCAEILRAPHMQDQFAVLMRAGNADITLADIDWTRVIANWGLPVQAARQ